MSNEEKTTEQKTEQVTEGLKSPPPTECKTSLDRLYEFRKPALKHRNIIMKVLKVMQEPTADYREIIKCAKTRGITLEAFMDLPEEDFTEDEKRKILKNSSVEDQLEFADMMNDILVETLYATIKKAPFKFSTMEEFEDNMDSYAEAVELFPIAAKWVALAALDLKKINRPNL